MKPLEGKFTRNVKRNEMKVTLFQGPFRNYERACKHRRSNKVMLRGVSFALGTS
jgi:hypothetical protein